ncbi:hypothetical protein AC578_1626 [Pseudocercospora eumusae]|uniref:Myb-like domain-containing protein n=1 Tax=Pseudocercospora eumusae TaxID=321146 RepID=A0A139HLY1_9PEZI|nr:hypothetical protein AC578_1626 [Pseudocercospora eumusae]
MGRPKGVIGMKWDDTRERELLLSIIQQLQPSPSGLDWAAIVNIMGGDASEAACKLKFSKLKKAADEVGKGHMPETPKVKGGKKRKTEAEDDEEDTPKPKKGNVKQEKTEDEDEV